MGRFPQYLKFVKKLLVKPQSELLRLQIKSTINFFFLIFIQHGFYANAQIPSLYLDADNSLFSSDGKQQIFVGHVVAIGPNALVTADKIILDKRTNKIEASGHAVLMNQGQIFTGELISYDLFNEDLFIEDATMVSKEKNKSEAVIAEILGFSPLEIEYESFRKSRIQNIDQKKQKIIASAQRLKPNEEISDDMIEKLALMLEQEKLTKNQINPALSRQSKNARDVYLRRRAFWEEGKKSAFNTETNFKTGRYIKIKSAALSRVQGNDFRAEDVMFTPCKCDEDEEPAWGINASKVKAQMGGYLDFYDSYIKVGGIPVLYSPFLKLPIKGERQSGFLAPNFYSSSETGLVFSSPVFFALKESSDLTVTPEYISDRGTRFGAEYRSYVSEGSRWQFNAETIKDSLWIEKNSERNSVRDALLTGLDLSRQKDADDIVNPSLGGIDAFRAQVKNPSYWLDQENLKECWLTEDIDILNECKNVEIRSKLDPPENLWRGKLNWKGVEYLAPRFSVESYGNYLTDHRYVEDLEFPREVSELIIEEKVQSFGQARYRLNLDGEKFNMSLYGIFGDYFLEPTSWAGQQIPFAVDLGLPMYTLYQSDLMKVFARISHQYQRIKLIDYDYQNFAEGSGYTLGGGSWQRSLVDLFLPVFPGSVANTHFFSQHEKRDIKVEGFNDLDTSIYSHRLGLETVLPMEGETYLYLSSEKAEQNSTYAGTYARHEFTIGTRFSARPVVDKVGSYGEDVQIGVTDDGESEIDRTKLTYYASDQSVDIDNSFSSDELTMFKHQKVTFFTDHSFGLFDKMWVKKVALDPDLDQNQSLRSRAESILARAKDIQIKNLEQLQDVGQYNLVEGPNWKPLSLGANISYDFLKAKERDQLQEEYDKTIAYNKIADSLGEKLLPLPELVEPWSELNLNATLTVTGFNFKYKTEYNLYKSIASKEIWSLRFPKYLNSNFQLSYAKDEVANIDSFGRLVASDSTTKGGMIVSNYIPNFQVSVGYYERQYSNSDETIYRHTEAIQYLPTSGCWGMSFVRNKKFEENEENATYRLELNIMIDGQKRAFPNLAGAVFKYFPEKS